MKKVLALMLAMTLLVIGLTGCSNGKSLEEVKTAGQLVMATSPDFEPFEFLDGDKVVGIEVEIMELICKDLGVELKIEQVDFESVLPGVQTGKYDVGVSGISVTPDREKNTLFTDPYCLAAQAIVVVEDSPIKSKADLTGKKISVQTATTAASFCAGEGYATSEFTANNDAQMALTTGKVDAWVIDDLTAKEMVDAYNAENPAKKLVVLDEAMTTEPYAFAFAKGSDELVAEINKSLNKLIADGTVKNTFDKYNAPYTAPESK